MLYVHIVASVLCGVVSKIVVNWISLNGFVNECFNCQKCVIHQQQRVRQRERITLLRQQQQSPHQCVAQMEKLSD